MDQKNNLRYTLALASLEGTPAFAAFEATAEEAGRTLEETLNAAMLFFVNHGSAAFIEDPDARQFREPSDEERFENALNNPFFRAAMPQILEELYSR